MSHTFTFKSTSSKFGSTYYPPIELDPRYEYTLGLIGLHTYNTMPNIHDGQNKFYSDNQVLIIPAGAYEVTDFEELLQNSLAPNAANNNAVIFLKPNNSTQQCEIASKFSIDFTKSNSIGGMLGFSKKVLQANVPHVSDLRIRIIKVITITNNTYGFLVDQIRYEINGLEVDRCSKPGIISLSRLTYHTVIMRQSFLKWPAGGRTAKRSL